MSLLNYLLLRVRRRAARTAHAKRVRDDDFVGKAESYAICKADMLIKGQDIANIVFGNTLSNDGLVGKVFDSPLSRCFVFGTTRLYKGSCA